MATHFVASRIDSVAANHQKSGLMGNEQLQKLFEIAWYPGRTH
jgi:hypothetical protein